MHNLPQNKIKRDSGAAMLMAVVLFLFISSTFILGVISPILKQATVSESIVYSKESYYLASGTLEDAVYRLQNGKSVASGDTVVLNGYTSTVTLTTTSNGKTIDVSSDRKGIIRKMQSQLTTGIGTAFGYGVQSGTGGFQLSGGARINGNVYSNGDILATNGVVITGSAIAANSVALSADQTNDTPTLPPNNISFRNTSLTQDFAQSFQLLTESPINKISLYIKKVGSPADATVRILYDSNGSPGTSDILNTNGVLTASLVSTNYGWVDIVLPDNPELPTGATYWFVVDSSTQNSTNYYVIGGNNTYVSGTAKLGKFNGTWSNTSPAGLDGYFKIYLGGITSTIGGDTYVGGVTIGSGGVGDAWAHNVQGATVAGNLYCQTGTINNKACNTSKADPSPVSLPVSDANIADWKDEASTGGVINGDYYLTSGNTASLGPKEITGNLIMEGGTTLTMTGTLWVHGDVKLITGGPKIKLASSYGTNSGVIVADRFVNLGGGAQLIGSGQTGSYLMLLTTSNCPLDPSCNNYYAMTLSGGALGAILSAPNGVLDLHGGASVKEATAYQIIASGGAQVTYDSGLASVNFSSGPSGGYNIATWSEVQ